MRQRHSLAIVGIIFFLLCLQTPLTACRSRSASSGASPSKKATSIQTSSRTKQARESGAKSASTPAKNISSRHNPEELCLLHEAIKRSLSSSPGALTKKDRVILSGIAWMVRFIEQDARFDAIFPEYIYFLTNLKRNAQGQAIGHIAGLLLRNAFRRAKLHLKDIFDKTIEDKWRFISILPLLYDNKVPGKPYLSFYRSHFPKGLSSPKIQTFAQALKKENYEVLGDLLRRESRLHAFLKKHPRNPYGLRASQLPSYLKQLKQTRFAYTWKTDPDDYIVQSILLKRLATALKKNNPKHPLRKTIQQYFRKEWSTLRHKTKSIELLAQSIQGLAQVSNTKSAQLLESVKYLMSRQNANGSWGTIDQAKASDLEKIRPTLHTILALQASRTITATEKKQKKASRIGWIASSACLLSKNLPPAFSSRQNPEPVCLLRQAINRSNSRVERSLLAGLHWLVKTVEKNASFDSIFPSYVILLDQLRQHHQLQPVGYIARLLLQNAFRRARPHLSDIFDKTMEDKWRFISILPLLYEYNISQKAYLKFYQTRFPKGFPNAKKKLFAQALKKKDYEDLNNLLEQEARLYAFLKDHPRNPYALRASRLPQYLKQLTRIKLTETFQGNDEAYTDQNYLVLRWLSLLKTWGKRTSNTRVLQTRLQTILQKEFATIRHKTEDMELQATTTQRLLEMSNKKLPLKSTIHHLISLQNIDGSWGTDEDFSKGTHLATRPTFTVLRALHAQLSKTHSTTPQTSLPTWLKKSTCALTKGLPPAFQTRQNPTTMCLIREAIKRSPSAAERGILAGLHWLITQVEKDAPYYFVFENYVAVLDKVAEDHNHPLAARLARRMIHEIFRRSQPRWSDIFFARDNRSKWRILQVLPLLDKYNIPKTSLLQFYKSLPKSKKRPKSSLTFAQALQQRKLQELREQLMNEFALYSLQKKSPKNPYNFPTNKLASYLKKIENISLKSTFQKHPDRYINESYFANHILQALRGLGSDKLASGPLVQRLHKHLQKQFPMIRYKVKDTDLLAMTIQSLASFPQEKKGLLKEAREYLLALQHVEGSWGKDADFASKDAFKRMTPTWAVLRALSSEKQKSHNQKTAPKANSPWPAGSACIRPKGMPPSFKSTNNTVEVQMLRKGILKTKSRVERAILTGMHWIISKIEDDANFEEGFGNYTTLMSEMAVYGKGTLAGTVAERLLRNAFHRAKDRLPKIFDANLADKGDFITTLFMLYKFNIPKARFIKFYQSYFPKGQPWPHKVPFKTALLKNKYYIIGTYIVDESFLDIFQKNNPKNPFNLRKSQLKKYIRLMGKHLKFIYDIDNFTGYNNQNYFVTHIVLAMNHYGESDLPKTPLTIKILRYFDKHFHKIRFKVRDLDLLGEFIYCYKIYGLGERADIKEAINYMLDLQHEDGSWGTDNDFGGGLYQQIHPTWAVITGLIDIKLRKSSPWYKKKHTQRKTP